MSLAVPDDIVKLILEHLHYSEACVFLSLVCKKWRSLAKRRVYSKAEIIKYYSAIGSISALNLIRSYIKYN